MRSDLEVDADAVRGYASTMADTATEIRAGTTPPSTVEVPRWQTTTAVENLADKMEHALTTMAGDLEALRRAVLAAVADYEAADERAADRLGRVR